MEIIIIGAGAAGLMCANQCLKSKNNHITILEKNEKAGKKIYITGKGRCNVTNYVEPNEFLDYVITNKKFLYSSIFNFTPKDTMNFFEENNISLKVERGNRVFPSSDKSSDIIKGLLNSLNTSNIKIKYNENVIEVKKENDKFIVITNNSIYKSDVLVIATGGVSYPSTGSTGNGYKFAKSFSHKVTKLYPALCSILTNYKDISKYAGVSLKNVNVKICDNNNKILHENFGELLFTHSGFSGPVVLTLSSLINKLPNLSLYNLIIDLKPALSNEMLDNRILRDFNENKNKAIKNALNKLLISSMIDLVLCFAKINPNKNINEITVGERQRLVATIKNLTFNIKSLDDIKNGIITSGGIDVNDINAKTMESKICKNLFFIGEIIDVDAKTGGFNLQIAFSTAVSAGNAILMICQIKCNMKNKD